MQLDSTRIAIRERDLLDLLDLSLRLVRAYAWPLFWATLAGALPFAVINFLLMTSVDADARLETRHDYFPYFWMMLLLILCEVPLAGSLITLFLGQAMFEEKPNLRRMLKELWRSLPQMVVLQTIIRGLMMPLVVTAMLPYSRHPYLSEIILLERHGFFRRTSGVSTTRRSAALHARRSADLLIRAIAVGIIALGMMFSIWQAITYACQTFTQDPISDWTRYMLHLPIAMWIVAGFCTVVRYLSYLDLRIRREGWEVELQLRAEAERLERQIA